jgi:hypothetical protein
MEAMDNAKVEGLKGDAARARGREIMTDANFPEPKTEAGKALRARAQYVAMRTLNVDKTIASDISVGVKNGINGAMKEATGMDIPLGTLAEPFAMIGTNLTQHSIEMNPVVGGGEAAWDMVRGKMKMSEDNSMATRYEGAAQYQKGIQKLIGVVGSVAMAGYLTSKLRPKDFRQDNYGNSFVNIGGVWINTEFFGRLSSNITAMMTLKQGKGIEASAEDSLLLPFKNTPLGSKVFGVLDTMTGKNGITKTLSGIPSSFLPAILTDLSNTRPIDRLFFGASGLETDTQYKADTVAKTQKAAATRKANLPKAKY